MPKPIYHVNLKCLKSQRETGSVGARQIPNSEAPLSVVDPVQCTVPGVVGGSTSETGQVDEGQVVTITCTSSSHSPSTPTITCTSSGTFDTTNPTCNKGTSYCYMENIRCQLSVYCIIAVPNPFVLIPNSVPPSLCFRPGAVYGAWCCGW